MALILVLVFIVVPLVELAVVVAAADSFGLGVTLVALLAFSVSGAWLMRREGIAVWRRANDELAAGRPPARELIDGAMILAGGALLLTPGFITDLVGLMLLLPPIRALVRPVALRAMTRRAQAAFVGATSASTSMRGRPGGSRGGGAAGGFQTVIIDADLFDPDLSGPRSRGAGPRRAHGAADGSAERPSAGAEVIRVDPLPGPDDDGGSATSGSSVPSGDGDDQQGSGD